MPLSRPPRLTYNGLTIVVSNPSRFDKEALLSVYAGDFFASALMPRVILLASDVRNLLENCGPLREGTKVVFCLGDAARKAYGGDASISLNQARGNTWRREGDDIIYLSSYLPQDCMDMRNYEASHNPILSGEDSEEEGYVPKKDFDSSTEKTTKGATDRANWRFWLEQDCKKVGRILKGEAALVVKPNIRVYPNANEVIEILSKTKNETLYLDIETNENLNVRCFGFSFGNSTAGPIYVVPLFNYNYSLAYDSSLLSLILRGLAIAMRDNEVVIHNSMFDLFVLAEKYRLPFGRRIFDTMLAHTRLYPDVEKSLGHCGSLYTYEPYHKNEGIYNPSTSDQEAALWHYNALDVHLMRLIKLGIEERSVGLQAKESIKQINASIYTYLLNTLMGIAYKREDIEAILAANDRRMTVLLKLITLLVGHEVLPTSPKACVNYFHRELRLKAVKKSAKTGKESLDETAMYKLYIKNDNPVIPLCLEFRRLSKESGSLKFKPWRETL